jgi:hydroxymethylbilane synthase
VGVERAFQAALGGGCHTAFAAHVSQDMLHLFHERIGIVTFPLSGDDFVEPEVTATRILRELTLVT